MLPVQFKTANLTLVGSGCADLPVVRRDRFFHSVWKPSAEELAILQAGGSVHLAVMGFVHPPVRLTVEANDVEPYE